MPQQIRQLTEDTYLMRTPSYFNCTYLVHREGETVLVDTGMKSDGSDVKSALKHLGIPLASVKAILLTHWHNDHSAGAAAIKAETGCKVYCHAADAPQLERTQTAKWRRLSELVPEMGPLVLLKGLIGNVVPRPVMIDHQLQDAEIILGNYEVIHTPGHTTGHAAYYDRQGQVLFAGDALAVIRQRLRLMAGPVTLDKQRARESVLRLLTGRTLLGICPGHREPLLRPAQAEIDHFVAAVEHMHRWPTLG